jgi:hypothetical protein
MEASRGKGAAQGTGRRSRTVLHGGCLLHGKHQSGSLVEARECPVLSGRITPEANTRRVGRPSVGRNPGNSPGEGVGSGSSFEASSILTISGSSGDSFSLQRGPGGRPRKYKDARERKREEVRRRRARRRGVS